MSIRSSLTPFVLGAVAGAVVLSGLAVGNDWVVTSEVYDEHIREAKVEAKADVCVALVRDHLDEAGKDPKLDGYTSDARDNRRRLARQYAVPMVGKEEVSDDVIRACSQELS